MGTKGTWMDKMGHDRKMCRKRKYKLFPSLWIQQKAVVISSDKRINLDI